MTDPTELLQRAFLQGDFVVVCRSIEGSDDVRGYVVGIGTGWVLLHSAADDVFLNGYAALRLSDVVAVEGSERDWFMPRGLEALGEHPVVPGDIPLDGTAKLSQALAARFELLTLYRESDDPDVCHIGRLVAASGTALQLRELAPAAEWEPEPTRHQLADVTRLGAVRPVRAGTRSGRRPNAR